MSDLYEPGHACHLFPLGPPGFKNYERFNFLPWGPWVPGVFFFYPRGAQGEFNYPRGAQGELILININPFLGPTFEAPPNGISLECRIQRRGLARNHVISMKLSCWALAVPLSCHSGFRQTRCGKPFTRAHFWCFDLGPLWETFHIISWPVLVRFSLPT